MVEFLSLREWMRVRDLKRVRLQVSVKREECIETGQIASLLY